MTRTTERLSWRRPLSVTKRPCMCCRVEFPSTGNHHRLCDECRVSAQDMSPMAPDYEWGERLLGNQTLARIERDALGDPRSAV